VPARAQPRADRSRYDLTVDIQPASNTVTGTVAVHFTPDLPTDRLVFRLWGNAPEVAGAGSKLQPGPVTIDGRAAASQQPDATTLVVPHAIAANHSVDVSLPWQLTLPGANRDRIARVGDNVRLGSFFPILSWEPGVGWATERPTVAHGETATTPAADFTAHVTVPPGYDVLATGVPDGNGNWSAPTAPDFPMTVGHFTKATATVNAPNPVQITVGVQNGMQERPADFVAKLTRVIQQYNQRFGPYPWPSYTLGISPELGGGIEFPMYVMQGSGTLGRTTSHELAHEWFYGLVENDQARDPFLDESLASWAESIAENTLSTFISEKIPPDAAGQLGSPMTYWDRNLGAYYVGIYVQGTKMLSSLGPPAMVDCALAQYVAANAYHVARRADLISALTKVFPNAPDVLAQYGIRADR